MCKLVIANRGFAKCYNKYTLDIRLTDESGAVYHLNGESPDSREWDADSINEITLRLDYTAVPKGDYRVELGLFSGKRAIKLALKEELLLPDGYYRVADLSVGGVD